MYAVNAFLADTATYLAGEHIDLHITWEGDEDPAFSQPGDDLLIAIQQSDLLLANSASYAKWRQQVSLPSAIVVDTSAGADLIFA